MKLEALATIPKLQCLKITDEEFVKKYGDEIEFYMYDRHDMDMYLRMSQVNGSDVTAIAALTREIVLKDDGTPALAENEVLPPDMMLKVIETAIQHMGNQHSQTSET
jgi:hypothetical protein